MKRYLSSLPIVLLFSSMLVLFNACDPEEDVKPACVPPTDFQASNNSPVKEGDAVQLTVTTVANATYNWTGPKNFTSSDQNPVVTYTKGAEGEYKVTVTVDGCTSKPHFTYIVGCVAPTVTSNSPATEGKPIELKASFAGEGAVYTWTGPNGFTSKEQNPTIAKAIMASAGTYSVSAIVKSCTTAVGTAQVVVKPAAPKITASAPTTIASGVASVRVDTTLNLNASIITDATYSWTGPKGFTANTRTISIPNVPRAAAGDYAVTATVNGVTSDPAVIPVKVLLTSTGRGCKGVTSVTDTTTGFTYPTVEIGTQCWFKHNLKLMDPNLGKDSLFSWVEIMAKSDVELQGGCPSGWHVPTDAEWNYLIKSSFVNYNGNTLKLELQGSGGGVGTNTSGFSAKFFTIKPVVYKDNDPPYSLPLSDVYFWTSTQATETHAYYYSLNKTTSDIIRDVALTASQPILFHVRCLKD